MARRRPPVVERCRYGVSLEQAKAFWNRKGRGHVSRQAALRSKGAKWMPSRSTPSDRPRLLLPMSETVARFVCEGGRIVGYSDDMRPGEARRMLRRLARKPGDSY